MAHHRNLTLINWLRRGPGLYLAALLFMMLTAVIAPRFAPRDPLQAISGQELRPPSAQFWFGTDLLGRDVFSRVLAGGRQTLFVALLALALAVLPGLAIGTLGGYLGGLFDLVLTTFIDALLAFPSLLLALSVIALAGTGPVAVGIAVGLAGIAPYARVARTAARVVRSSAYIEASRMVGATDRHIIWVHLLPNMTSTLLAFAAVTLSWAALNAATLHFLGFGGDPSVAEWGSMLAEARQAFRTAPWAAVAPGLAIMLTLMLINGLAARAARQPC